MPVLRPVFMQPAARPSPGDAGSDGADSVLRNSRSASLLSGAAREMREMGPRQSPGAASEGAWGGFQSKLQDCRR